MLSMIRAKNRARGGQTLVIAIMVMFLLAVVAAVFIALVARNLIRSGRFSNVDAVAQIAEAGIRYADKMLTSSEDGADWRPIPDNHGCINGGNPFTGVRPTPDPNWQMMRDRFPDFKWTRPYWPTELPEGSPEGQGFAGPTGGFTTYGMGQGRFLLRISYNPDSQDPLSKYIKIESIGRWGVFDEQDPTTWKPVADINLRREITAYKPIGVTDYLRFITNKDSRALDFGLGCPGYQIQMGRFNASDRAWNRGAPIRVNGNLMWYGAQREDAVKIYLRGVYDRANNMVPIDRVEVSGEIKIAEKDTGVQLFRVFPDSAGPVGPSVALPSDDPNYRTFSGFYRDGSGNVDADNFARSVKRIEPPLVDQPDPTNTTTRYRLLTLDSGERIGRINLGRYGWGRGIYINNRADIQDESETLFGGYTLRADWLKPNSPMSTYWKGPFYVPPGVIITLNPGDIDNDPDHQPDITITRTDAISATGAKAFWNDAWGNPRPEWGATVIMPYPDPVKGRTIYFWENGRFDPTRSKHLDGNGVIYAEGNVRIRGMLPPGMQLTIVSNGTIYIEGNLLKFRDPTKGIDSSDPWRGADNTCGLALLARENICVNTTQFFSPTNSISAEDVGSDSQDGRPPYHIIVSNDPESRFRCSFECGPWESQTGNPPKERYLYLRHAGQYGSSYINAWINPSSQWPDFGMLYLNRDFSLPDGFNFAAFPNLPKHVWGVGDPHFNRPGWGIGSSFAGDIFALVVGSNAHLLTAPGLINILQIGLDQTTYTRNNYLLGGLAIQPMDIRIEAILCAQNGSFFVIPGNWFNPNPSDTVPPTGRVGAARPPGVRAMFPFYGDALDIRIIIDGAVTENIPAAISDVSEWMAKWGRIPPTYGASGVPTAHPEEGLTFLYDDHVGWPLSNGVPIRMDKFGRALPICPKLPVSSSLVYFGDVM